MWISGRPRSLRIEGGRIVETGPASGEHTLVPSVIDAHVHLAFAGMPVDALIRAGVAGVLDLGAPLPSLPLKSELRTAFAGPMLTAPRGYPTQSWGKNGFGAEFSTPDAARTLVHQLFELGARFVKLSFDSRYTLLQPEVARAASEEAHTLKMKVAAHALDLDAVTRALDAGVDILAHTPREELPADVLYKLRGKWVISTLRAFDVDPRRLAALCEAGMRVAYGTDLGNEGTSPRIDEAELHLLQKAGVDPLQAATADAAALCGFADLGRLDIGFSACVLAIGQSLARPERVVHCGKVVA